MHAIKCAALMAVLVVLAAVGPAQASSNGCLWECNLSAGGVEDGKCVFSAASQSTVDACTSGLTAITNVVEHSLATGCAPGDAAEFANQKCNVYKASDVAAGTCGSAEKAVSPLPLTNGDCVKVDASALAQEQLNWALVNTYGEALRNKVMFNPSTLVSQTEWDKWTKPLTDCKIKIGSSSRLRRLSGGTEYNSNSIHEIISDPCGNDCTSGSKTCGGNGPGLHNYVLQYLEEAVIDLGCLVSSTLSVGSPDRCATIQSALGVSNTDYPDCWVAGWEAIFGVAPNAIGLSTYSGAAGTVAASECGATSGAPAAVGAGALRTALLAALAFAAVLMSRAQLLA